MTATEILYYADVPGGVTTKRLFRLIRAMRRLTDVERENLRIVVVSRKGSDPLRWGKSKDKKDRCAYLGRSSHKGGVEIWADWS